MRCPKFPKRSKIPKGSNKSVTCFSWGLLKRLMYEFRYPRPPGSIPRKRSSASSRSGKRSKFDG